MVISTNNPSMIVKKLVRLQVHIEFRTLCRWNCPVFGFRSFARHVRTTSQGHRSLIHTYDSTGKISTKYVCRQSRETLNQDRYVHSVLNCHQSKGSFASLSKSFVTIIPIYRQAPDELCFRYNTCDTTVKLTSLSDGKYVSYFNCLPWEKVSTF